MLHFQTILNISLISITLWKLSMVPYSHFLSYLPFAVILDSFIMNIMQVIHWKDLSKINSFLNVFFWWWVWIYWAIQDLLGESSSDLWITTLQFWSFLFVKLLQLLLYFALLKSYHSRYVPISTLYYTELRAQFIPSHNAFSRYSCYMVGHIFVWWMKNFYQDHF